MAKKKTGRSSKTSPKSKIKKSIREKKSKIGHVESVPMDVFFNVPPEKYKRELQYDAKVWLNEQEICQELVISFECE